MTETAGHGQREHLPRLIAWEVTRRCHLACKHCRAAAKSTPYAGELSTEECHRLLDNIAAFAKPTIILTGGEPMLREDIYEIASYAHGLGLPVVMAPCGMLLNEHTATKILESGIHHISLSLDGATPHSHDAFRGVEGAFDAVVAGIATARKAGLKFQINTTVTKHNIDELPAILDLSRELGAAVFNPFLLVPTGRGKELADQEITPEEYERTLHWLASQHDRNDIKIRVTCAPHYQRILRQLRRLDVEGERPSKGCMGGQAFAFISHRGKVQICGFLEIECGDLRREDFAFRKIWETSEVFLRVRDLDAYEGRCGICEFRKVCGGCRARAHAMTGNYLAEEPFCVYQPKRASSGPVASSAEGELDELDKRILSCIQANLPVDTRPFDVLAERLKTDAEDVMERVGRLHRLGIIRRLGPVFASSRLGYASTLVAARIPTDRLAEAAELVSRLPGVTHNYRRNHRYNLWFTFTGTSTEDIDATVESLRQQTGIRDFYSLPALALYKIHVNFNLSEDECLGSLETPAPKELGPPARLDERQQELVRLLQDGLPLDRQPFDAMAERLGCCARDVVRQIADWLADGVIRRFGATVHHRRLGFSANGMAVFHVATNRIDTVGRRLTDYPEISHCYRRPPLPGFQYQLFAMVHGKDEAEVRQFVERVAEELDINDHEVLFSTAEYKKCSMKYFVPQSLGRRAQKQGYAGDGAGCS